LRERNKPWAIIRCPFDRRLPVTTPRSTVAAERLRPNNERHGAKTDHSMCGITGYLCDDPRARNALPAMMAALVHRGPDSDGCYFDGPIGLGFRRLAVIDIEGSRQPLVAADGTI